MQDPSSTSSDPAPAGASLRAAPSATALDPWADDEGYGLGDNIADGEDRLRRRRTLLFVNVFIVATCGLVYELLAGAIASYLLGDSVTQFSLVIGLYLSAMGIGAWLSRHLVNQLGKRFVEVELAVALVGGVSAPALFLAYGTTTIFKPLMYLDVIAVGVLVGLELPLLMRILEGELQFKDLVSRTLTFDYLGALCASLLFPLVLLPTLGLVRTGLLVGLINAGVAWWGIDLLRGHIGPRGGKNATGLRLRVVVVAVLLLLGLVKAESLTTTAEERVYSDPIVYAEQTPYQRIVVTESRAGFALYLNGNLQLHSHDEYRYHEALVHPAMLAFTRGHTETTGSTGSTGSTESTETISDDEVLQHGPKRVLVLGGGDGLALRELLRYPSIEHITLVDLDPGMTSLSERFPPLKRLNGSSFQDPRVEVVHADAYVWLDERQITAESPAFDVAIVDFPDPNHLGLGKLYTRHLYRRLREQLVDDGVVCIQSTSPLFVPKSYWTIVTTLEAADWRTLPYQAAVPSFGVWGFVLAQKATPAGAGDVVDGVFNPWARSRPEHIPTPLASQLRYLTDDTLTGLFVFPKDMQRVEAEVNRLDNQALVRTYDHEVTRAMR